MAGDTAGSHTESCHVSVVQAGVQMFIALLVIAISLYKIPNPNKLIWEAW